MFLAITIVAALLLGAEVTDRIPRDDERPARAERLLYAMAIGTLLWLASTWLLASLHLLRQPLVIARTVVFALAALPGAIRRVRNVRALDVRPLLALIPLVLWLAFILWRGALVPVLSHDALSYHLPKAALYVRAGGFSTLSDLAWLITPRPSNYELLLADAIALEGTDRVTEWISTWFYLLFIAGGIALAERWWRIGSRTAIGIALLTGCVPLLLLHSGAHKNDLMLAALAVAALVAAGRFLTTRELAAFCIGVAALIAGAGTKTHGLVIAGCIAPLLVWPLLKPFSARRLAIAIGATLVAALLLGGIDYAARFAQSRNVRNDTTAVPIAEYGDWDNLWKGPYVLLAAPFSGNPFALSVPWEAKPMFWRRYELYFSHLGIPFAVAALLTPFAMAWLRRRDEHSRERFAVTAAAIAAFLLLLPVHYEPIGLYLIYMPRFVLFIVPIAFAWTLAPLLEALTPQRATVAHIAAALVFVIYGADMATDDSFTPIDYVMWARTHPGRRIIPFDPNRATSLVDRAAGPRDRILIDAGTHAWIYPAYGERLTRDVRILAPEAATIPDDADWVVVEHRYQTVWGNPSLRNIADASRFLTHGRVGEKQQRLMRALASDPRYETLFLSEKGAQAVFRRKR